MASRLKGISVTLYDKIEIGRDDFNKPIYEDEKTVIDNVLVEPLTATEILDTLNLTGRRAVYRLGIPKGDTHEWENKKVSFFEKDWYTIGPTLEGIEAMIPLDWNKKVQVERIE